MSINQKCHGLIKSNELYSNVSDIIPLRVAVLDGCHFTLIYYFNIMMKALKRPFVLTYCDSYGGPGRSIQDELYSNRSEFSPNLMEVNPDWYQNIKYSPSFFFGNAITILSGKIMTNNGNGFSILSSFSLHLWLIFFAILILIAIFNNILHHKYSKWTLYLTGVVGHFMKLWAVFINQSNQFGNICCVKHLILNLVTVISIFIITLFFTSEILSNLLFNPLVKIDTLDDLVVFGRNFIERYFIGRNFFERHFIEKNYF